MSTEATGFVSRTGRVPEPHAYEALNPVDSDILYTVPYQATNPTGDQERMIAEAELLWDHFFITYFPEANKKFNITKEDPKTGDNVIEETNGWEVLEKDPVTGQHFAANIYYKNTFHLYLKNFTDFLLNHGEINLNGVDLDSFEEYRPSRPVTVKTELVTNPDDPNGPLISKVVPDKEAPENIKKLEIWKNYLEQKTDISERHNAVYLWAMFEILEIMKSLQQTVTNRAEASRVFFSAQRQIVSDMASISYKEQFFIDPIIYKIMGPDEVKFNGEQTYTVTILKAHQQRVQANAENKKSNLDDSLDAQKKQNSLIAGMINQIEQVLNDIIK